ncbi:DUF3857 domain-containing protein [Allosphingosinicella indica]|uniref:DUF3857 domain-containing protein n=1 Tax=Allosphingosinicella indica TaxID=941907 RepID=UPI00313927CF
MKPVAVPDPDPKLADRTAQSLLVSSQQRFVDGQSSIYVEVATRLQNAQALNAGGTIAIPWDPERLSLAIHKVQILRAGKVIDVLASGQEFTVLRRESNLERAMLDGTLTAVLQPEGLAVGDTILTAFSFTRKPGSIHFRPLAMIAFPYDTPIRQMSQSVQWDDAAGLRWKSTLPGTQPRETASNGVKSVRIEYADLEIPSPPTDLPARLRIAPLLEFTGYGDWGEIGRLYAPVYAETSRLEDASPVKAQAAAIAARHPHAKNRAMAALRLVQDEIRYVALGMNEGGILPASADRTWSRKFGDCKGKTVLLIALLKELGVEAKPLLVSDTWNTALGDRLPNDNLFDHVIVEATIDGETYWMDGTRLGDRDLDALRSSPFGYGVLVSTDSTGLKPLPLLPAARPLTETDITYDASKGFLDSVPVKGTVRYRGDLAINARMAVAQVGRDAFLKTLRDQAAAIESDDIKTSDFTSDEASGDVVFTFTGTARMAWPDAPGGVGQRFRFDDDVIRWTQTFDRPATSPHAKAPFALNFPFHIAWTETVILPRNGKGFSIEGTGFEKTIAGAKIARSLSLADGKAVARSSFQFLQPEVSYDVAVAAKGDLQKVNADRAYIRTPAGYEPTDEEVSAFLEREPTDAAGWQERGFRHMRRDEHEKAAADFAKAAELDGNWSVPHANRGLALVYLDRFEEAEKALARAREIEPGFFVIDQAYGTMYFRKLEVEKAAQAFTASLKYEPDNHYNRQYRAIAYAALGRYDEALGDIDHILKQDPARTDIWIDKARVLAKQGRQDPALEALTAGLAVNADNLSLLQVRATMLTRFGRADEAKRAYDRLMQAVERQAAASDDPAGFDAYRANRLADRGDTAGAVAIWDRMVAKTPRNPTMLNNRCWTRTTAGTELEKALADCDAALAIEPAHVSARDSRGLTYLKLGRFPEAIADFDFALGKQPAMAESLYGRGVAKLRSGDKAGGEQDIARARLALFDIDAEYAGYGITP